MNVNGISRSISDLRVIYKSHTEKKLNNLTNKITFILYSNSSYLFRSSAHKRSQKPEMN